MADPRQDAVIKQLLIDKEFWRSRYLQVVEENAALGIWLGVTNALWCGVVLLLLWLGFVRGAEASLLPGDYLVSPAPASPESTPHHTITGVYLEGQQYGVTGVFHFHPPGPSILEGVLSNGEPLLVTFSGFSEVPPEGSPKLELHPTSYAPFTPVDPLSWVYYLEVKVWVGEDLYLDFGPAFQAGVGASGKHLGLGLSGWLSHEAGGYAGDLNLALTPATPASLPSTGPLMVAGLGFLGLGRIIQKWRTT